MFSGLFEKIKDTLGMNDQSLAQSLESDRQTLAKMQMLALKVQLISPKEAGMSVQEKIDRYRELNR